MNAVLSGSRPIMKKLAGCLFLPLLLAPLGATAGPMEVRIEPVVGYERDQKFVPTPHTHDRLIYGARALVGIPIVSGEIEYTRATDTEEFPASNLTVLDVDDTLKLGARSSVKLGGLLSVHARAGVQADKNVHTETVSGVSTVTAPPISYKPYAGAGLRAGLSNKIVLAGDLTVVFRDFPDMTRNVYQATLGLSVRFP